MRAMDSHERAAVKTCRKCGVTKKRSEFYPVGGKCKRCYLALCKEYNAKPEVVEMRHARQQAYYAIRKAQIQAERKAKWEANPERRARFNVYLRQHYAANRDMYAAKVGKRRAARVNATPAWADLKAIREFYRRAKEMTEATGIRHVVDHVIPLQGKTVCGLHVHTNLQVIPEKENLTKFNRLTEEIV